MNTKKADIKVRIQDEYAFVNLKWLRGASRYNNCGNHNGKLLKDKYPIRIILGRLKDIFNSK
jgi:hypothetical protein